jgi:hypothetical protein
MLPSTQKGSTDEDEDDHGPAQGRFHSVLSGRGGETLIAVAKTGGFVQNTREYIERDRPIPAQTDDIVFGMS